MRVRKRVVPNEEGDGKLQGGVEGGEIYSGLIIWEKKTVFNNREKRKNSVRNSAGLAKWL